MNRTLGGLRLIAGSGAIASALPFLALKLVWLGGGTLGVADQVMMRDTSMVVLNAVTAGMDVVGIALALALRIAGGSAYRCGSCSRQSGSQPACSPGSLRLSRSP